jgi:hypothetical protein
MRVQRPNDPSSPAGLSASSTPPEATCPAQDSQVQRRVRRVQSEIEDGPQSKSQPCSDDIPSLPFSRWLRSVEACPKTRADLDKNFPHPGVMEDVLNLWRSLGRPEITEWPEFVDERGLRELLSSSKAEILLS